MTTYHILKRSQPRNGVEFHWDILSPSRTVLSQERAHRPAGTFRQEPNSDKHGVEGCDFCNPERVEKDPRFRLVLSFLVDRRIVCFDNNAPYLPFNQKVMYMWHDDVSVRRRLHVVQLADVGREELYFLLKSATELGKQFASRPIETGDSLRMVFGFNFGSEAGQSVPHVHAQYGWEVVLPGETVTQRQIDLFYEECRAEGLIMYPRKKRDEKSHVMAIAPWTPKGKWHVDLHFPHRYETRHLEDADCKLFAHLGHRILAHYLSLGIQNVNVVFLCSALGRSSMPVIARFVPRINKPALYEVTGVDVVDTFPQDTVAAFNNVQWPVEVEAASEYDPEHELAQRLGEVVKATA